MSKLFAFVGLFLLGVLTLVWNLIRLVVSIAIGILFAPFFIGYAVYTHFTQDKEE